MIQSILKLSSYKANFFARLFLRPKKLVLEVDEKEALTIQEMKNEIKNISNSLVL